MSSVKEMCDTLALAYDDSKEVRRNKLTLLRYQYEVSSMEENESIQSMIAGL